MIRVTIDVIPFGKEEDRKTLHILNIINDGTGNGYIGNYDVQLDGEMKGHINQFRRGYGVLELTRKALKEVVK